MAEENAKSVSVPLEWHIPDNVVSRYATNLVVQHSPHEFIISFFEAQPPIIVGNDEAELANIKSLRAECVGRIIVAPDRMPEFISVLQANFQLYRSQFDGDEQ